MRFSAVTLLTLGGLLATSTATPVERHQDPAAITYLNDLLVTVKTYTGAINATVATISADSSDIEKAAAITSIGAELTSITDAIAGVTTSVKALTPVPVLSKRSSFTTEIEARQDSTSFVLLGAALAALLLEIFGTVSLIVASLGLTGLLSFLNSLTAGLGALILALEVTVDFLLLDVTILLNSLLTGLGLALGGLIL